MLPVEFLLYFFWESLYLLSRERLPRIGTLTRLARHYFARQHGCLVRNKFSIIQIQILLSLPTMPKLKGRRILSSDGASPPRALSDDERDAAPGPETQTRALSDDEESGRRTPLPSLETYMRSGVGLGVVSTIENRSEMSDFPIWGGVKEVCV
jgi:hypothetical protein